MAHIQTESEWQEEMSAKIVEFVRHELYMELRYLKLALSQLQLQSDPDLRHLRRTVRIFMWHRNG